MKLRLAEWITQCNKCKHRFTSFSLVGDYMPYGCYYMYARNGDIAYWEAVTDYIFTECGEIIFDLLPSTLTDVQKRAAAWLVRGICCDRAADGSIYQESAYCPLCGSSSHEVNYVEPRHEADMEVPDVTHHHWNSLSQEQKRQLVHDEMKRKALI
jgi:hypothetical protein